MTESYYIKHKLALGKGDHSAYGGMVLVHELLERTGIMSASDSILGEPGSGRGRRNSCYVGTFAQLFLSGGDCLADVSELEGDCLAQGFPSRQSLSSFLERKSTAEEYPKVEALFGVSVSRCLRGVPRDEGRVLDIDEQRVACEKECSERDYKGERSLMHTMVFDSGTGMVLASRLDPGNCTPGTGRADVLEAAAGRLGGRKVKLVRADAAYCNAETIGWCQKRESDFVIRHNPRGGGGGPPAGIRDEDLELVEAFEDGSAWVSVRTTSTLRGRVKPFSVVHYKRVGPGIQGEMLGGHYAIATSLDGIGALELRELYNRRGDDCENRIKEYGSDLAGKRMSSSKLGPNRVLAHMKAIAHNLFMLLRRLLFGGWRPRLKKFRLKVLQVPCSLVTSGRRTLLRIHNKAKYRQLVKWSRKLGGAFAP